MKLNLQSLPFAPSFRGYRLPWLRNDVSAGLAIAAVGLPSAIAYPAIAGLPPETGLYASITPLVAYALFGPSRQLIVGPDAATMTVLAAAMAAVLAAAPGADRVAVAATMALCVGALCLLARVLHLGIIASFLSRPILIGFFAGISLSIMIGQIKRVTGVSVEADGLISPLVELIQKANLIHWPSLLLAAVMFALLQVSTAFRSPVPGPVLVVVISVALSFVFDFQGHGIAVVGDVPTALPSLRLPPVGDLPFDLILSGSAAIFLVSFGAGIVTARSFGARGGYRVDADGELVGFGAANVAAGLFGTFPVTASDSRTAINANVGGRSQMASIVAAAALIATLLFLSDALKILPVPALGAILVAAAISLIDLGALRQIWRISPMEFVFALIALFGPIGLGVLYGVIIAIGATLLYVLRQMMFPREAMLGRIPGRDGFYKLHRSPAARAVPGLAITIVQGSLLFFNSDYVETRLRAIAETLSDETRWFVLDASAIAQIDSTGAGMLGDFATDLANRGIAVGLAELHADARALLERAGVLASIGPAMIFDDLDDALRAFEARSVETSNSPMPS
ncbi:SulP family inorganic anion transporter [Mesorhizobium sp. ASY16-5R]|uniref:SulP family inorganic anion transporter n=1 Tax=Mesorhizobium sp. ASY16-5R TaxID=3445772 RepID=UPI003F9F0623